MYILKFNINGCLFQIVAFATLVACASAGLLGGHGLGAISVAHAAPIAIAAHAPAHHETVDYFVSIPEEKFRENQLNLRRPKENSSRCNSALLRWCSIPSPIIPLACIYGLNFGN